MLLYWYKYNDNVLFFGSESPIDVLNAFGESPLHLAARMTHNHIVEILVLESVYWYRMLSDCISSPFLRPHYIDLKVGNSNKQCVHSAVSFVVNAIIVSECNVNLHDPARVTALHTAVSVYSEAAEFEDFLKIMIGGGCDLNLASNNGEVTPLCRAIDVNKYDLAILLLHHGADPNILCPHETTVLHRACHRKDVQLISELLDSDINWAAEGWLFTNMHNAGINPDILIAEGRDENVPLVLLNNVKLFHAIMDIRFAPQSLKQLCRLVVRRCLYDRLYLKVEQLFLPPSLKGFIMMKVN